MEDVVAAIATVHNSSTVSPPWQTHPPSPQTPSHPSSSSSTPQQIACQITPVAREHILVGRETSIDRVTTQLLATPCSRVLIYGDPGVGKDTVAAEVVHTNNVQQLGGLQAWLQASSDLVFRRQLIDVFLTHRPSIVRGCEIDASACVKKIFTFLRDSGEGWLFVMEDMSSESTTASNLLSETNGVSRVLITIQAPLHALDPSWSSIKLEPFTTDDSVDLLRRMNLFSKKIPDLSDVDETMSKTQVEAAVSTFCSQLPKHYTRHHQRTKKQK